MADSGTHPMTDGPADEDAATDHVSGIVVNAVPAHADAVAARIDALDGAEVAAREGGRMVVVLEAPDEHGLADLVHRISLFENVYSAALVSHYRDVPGGAAAHADGEAAGGTPTGEGDSR